MPEDSGEQARKQDPKRKPFQKTGNIGREGVIRLVEDNPDVHASVEESYQLFDEAFGPGGFLTTSAEYFPEKPTADQVPRGTFAIQITQDLCSKLGYLATEAIAYVDNDPSFSFGQAYFGLGAIPTVMEGIVRKIYQRHSLSVGGHGISQSEIVKQYLYTVATTMGKGQIPEGVPAAREPSAPGSKQVGLIRNAPGTQRELIR